MGTTEQVLRLAEARATVALDRRRFTPAIDAVRTQRAYLQAARRLRDRRPADDVVLDAWSAALDDHEARGPIETWYDWIVRERAGHPLGQLRPSTDLHALFGAAAMAICTDAAIETAVSTPPDTTRASLRGRFIATAKSHRRDFTVDWVHLRLNDQADRTLRCWDPLDAG